jgi:D-glycero-alpha-D-manno-heptose-7-phosphate kinase
MIISRTPLRISFVGGGSDLPSYYQKKKGAVVSTAIDKYIYITVGKQFDGRIIVSYSQNEIVTKVSDIKNNLVREAMKVTGITDGIHITSISDLPSEGTGMGSSSAYVVGLLNALYAYQGKHVNAEKLAREACKIEIDILKKPIGKQDQYIAAYGGLEYIQFNADDSVYVDPIICLSQTKREVEKNLLLFYTGITRSADPILSKQNQNMKSHTKQQAMKTMVTYADKLRRDLNKNNSSSFGTLLHKNWLLKKNMADGISTPHIERLYTLAKKNGAIGGKLLGAGGGGFLLFYAPIEKHQDIIKALSGLIPLPFKFEPQGSKIIFVGE